MSRNYLTPTEQRIYDLLADGREHTIGELLDCLYDSECGEKNTLHVHICSLRKYLRRQGRDIVYRGNQYRQVQDLPQSARRN